MLPLILPERVFLLQQCLLILIIRKTATDKGVVYNFLEWNMDLRTSLGAESAVSNNDSLIWPDITTFYFLSRNILIQNYYFKPFKIYTFLKK